MSAAGRGSAVRSPSTRLRVPSSRDARMRCLTSEVQRWATFSPARLTTASRPASASAGAGPATGSQPTAATPSGRRPAARSGLRVRAVTSSPRAISASASPRPMPPVAPVSVTRMLSPPSRSLAPGRYEEGGTRVHRAMASRPDELYLIDGNSLVYRAFFALPESIATSTGFPTNAIFGFASMLVKILTEHGTKPTVVVWDAGSSGRKEVYAEYKAGRAKRPTLLGEQWPHFEPLVEAFGYRNVHVDGFEADDVIASIAERAREADPPIPTIIVTGDRDAFQLIDPDGVVKVMATSARDHRDEAVRPRGGRRALRHPARAHPRLLRPQGRHERQHPRRPRHRRQDRVAAPAAVRRPRGRALARSTTSPAPSASRTSPSTPTTRACRRCSRRCGATSRSTSTSPPRRRRRPTAPGCARSSASSSCATRCAAWRRSSARTRPRPRQRADHHGRRARSARARSSTSARCRWRS